MALWMFVCELLIVFEGVCLVSVCLLCGCVCLVCVIGACVCVGGWLQVGVGVLSVRVCLL